MFAVASWINWCGQFAIFQTLGLQKKPAHPAFCISTQAFRFEEKTIEWSQGVLGHTSGNVVLNLDPYLIKLITLFKIKSFNDAFFRTSCPGLFVSVCYLVWQILLYYTYISHYLPNYVYDMGFFRPKFRQLNLI